MISYGEFVDLMFSGCTFCFDTIHYFIHDGMMVVQVFSDGGWKVVEPTIPVLDLKSLYDYYVEQDPRCWITNNLNHACSCMSKRYVC